MAKNDFIFLSRNCDKSILSSKFRPKKGLKK